LNVLDHIAGKALQWFPELGIGYFPVKASPYDAAYFEHYKGLETTEIGQKLNQARIELVNKYTDGQVLDIGIGSGAFVAGRQNTWGYDINPAAIEWLMRNKKYRNPFRVSDALTFWDSLEHIHDPESILQGAREFVFVSCPIYRDADHILSSKHYKKDEHCWYWTVEGLVLFMEGYGFMPMELNWMESEIGREDIGTFVFKRTA
jgi:hypothetical protein